jgi:hypothetical protein
MSWQYQCQSVHLSGKIIVKADFSREQDVGPALDRVRQQIAPGSTNDGHPFHDASWIAYHLNSAGGLSYGTSGIGGTPHVAGEMLAQRTGSSNTGSLMR